MATVRNLNPSSPKKLYPFGQEPAGVLQVFSVDDASSRELVVTLLRIRVYSHLLLPFL